MSFHFFASARVLSDPELRFYFDELRSEIRLSSWIFYPSCHFIC